jgi:hypothetical protein
MPWASRAPCPGPVAVGEFQHPLVGRLVLHEEIMELSEDEGQRLVIFSAKPDSPSEAGLRLLTGGTVEIIAPAVQVPDGLTRWVTSTPP